MSVDPPEVEAAFRAGAGARWTLLSDAERCGSTSSVWVEASDSTHRPYLPRVFTLRLDRTIHASYDGYWFWGRPTNEELRQDLRAISQIVRQDWEPPAR